MYLSKSILLLILLLFMGCNNEQKTTNAPIEEQQKNIESTDFTENSAHFSVEQYDGYKIVKVIDPWKGANRTYTYLLVQKGVEPPKHISADETITIPLENIVCFSTSHIPLLEYIGEEDKLIGFPNTNLISSNKVRQLVDNGKVIDLGSEMDVNVESLLALNPDMVLTFGMGEQSGQFDIVKNAGIPVVYNADYMEKDPLGRAEWIKFVGLFFNKVEKADSVYNSIKTRYDSLKQLIKDVEVKPTVFSGIMYGDTWFMPGGENYAGKFFEDAGAKYMWGDNEETGYLKLSFENVFEKAYNADFWIGVGSYNNLDEMQKSDNRYALFNAFKNKRIYNFNSKIGLSGGNEYFELGYLRPDLVLGDLIKIFHEDKLPNHQFYFHKKLQ